MSSKMQNVTAGKTQATHLVTYRRIRLILDGILILLLIWIASGKWLVARAEPARQAELVERSGPIYQAGNPDITSGAVNSQQSPTLIDNNTLAAIIAAENEALTPPIYFVDLPLISH